jgi:penicillin-binding protein 1C
MIADKAPRRRANRRAAAGLGLAAAISMVVAAAVALDAPLAKLEVSSPVVLDRNGVWLRALPVEDGRWRLRADLDRTDPLFVRRLVALEDRRFWIHPGVDPAAVMRAAVSDLSAGRIRSGGSTLTMQLARRLDPRRRTLGAKLVEAGRALALEARLGKRGVLGAYLTLAPYGGDLEGVRAASLAYFGHEPSTLTDAEQALLIAIPRAPEAFRPDRRPAAARTARDRVLARLVAQDLISPQAAREAAGEPVPRRHDFPVRAWAASGAIARAAPPTQPTVISALDAALQARLEILAQQTAAGQGPATSAAIMVVETQSRAVRAAVTSAGSGQSGSWIDETRALRSPGSSLKPFLYAIAFEQGLAAPDTELADSPVSFAGYAPENFDRSFHGEVSAREALANSLNVPAVTLLARVGPAAFEARLRGAGAVIVRPREGLADPGLAMALGGEGISLRDLAMLYAALSDAGLAKPLAWTQAEAQANLRAGGRRLVSAEAAGEVLAILREGAPPGDRVPAALSADAPKLAFKTGTSYGFRDAVAAGVGDGWTVVVWTGRPDGGARPGLTGRDAALPLLFQVFDMLTGERAAARPIGPPAAPPALTRIDDAHAGPQLLFPPDGAAVLVGDFGPRARGLALAARGMGVRWYVNGAPLAAAVGGDTPVWRPPGPGFYDVMAVDSLGRRAKARVRVKAG